MSDSDNRRRSRKSRKLVGGRGWFGNDAVGAKAEVKNVKQQFDKLIADQKKQIFDLKEQIDGISKETKKAVLALDEKEEKLKKDLRQKEADLSQAKKDRPWFGGRKSRRSRKH